MKSKRLRAAELDAKQRYYETVEESDLSATRCAAGDWIRAGDALAQHVAMHQRTYSEYSQAADRSSSALTNNSENGAILAMDFEHLYPRRLIAGFLPCTNQRASTATYPKFAVIGTGTVGLAFVRQLVLAGIAVSIAKPWAPETIRSLVDELGDTVTARTLEDTLAADVEFLVIRSPPVEGHAMPPRRAR